MRFGISQIIENTQGDGVSLNYHVNFQSFILNRELQARKLKNPEFSLRSFSRYLGISSGAVSRAINKKRSLGKDCAKSISETLEPNSKETKLFCNEDNLELSRPEIEEDELGYKIIVEWEHFGVLEFLSVEKLKTVEDLLEWFDITPTRLFRVLRNLESYGLIEFRDGKIVKVVKSVVTSDDKRSEANRLAHVENCKLAEQKLESIDSALRDFSCLVAPFDLDKMDLAKEVIRKFRRDFIRLFGEADQKHIYQMNLQFFPLTKVEKNKDL